MLNKIVLQQQKDLQQLQNHLPLRSFASSLTQSTREFHRKLLESNISYIFECKHRSPSTGALREDYPISTLARSYAGFATAISVLTNKPFFGGSFEHLKIVSEAITLPVLCKDIIIHPYQVALARLHQADAILLMLSVLDDNTYQACKSLAISLNMAVVTEVYSEEEMIRANRLKANIILVNQRCLHSMKIDKKRVLMLTPYFSNEAIIIGASGIETHRQINTLKPFVNGYLIGSALSKSKNISQTMKNLIFGPIKVCGLTRLEDAQIAHQLGATYGGLIFAPNSLRKVTLSQALPIATSGLSMVGVFANQPIEELINIANKLKLTAVQLHGNESPETILSLREHLPQHCQIWLAIDGNLPLPELLPHGVDKLIVDNKTDCFGGTGRSFDWCVLNNSPLLEKIMLSGGICASNAIKAKQTSVWGIDVNSGVEHSPGIKDKTKLEKLFNLLKTHGGRHANSLFR